MRRYIKISFFFTLLIMTFFSINSIFAQFENLTKNVQFNVNESVEIESGGSVKLDIEVIVPQGNHIYIDHIDPESFTILTSFSFPEDSPFKIDNVNIPEGEVEGGDLVLRGKGVFTLHINQTKEIEVDSITLPLNIRSQMCNDDGRCYPPYDKYGKTLTFNIMEKVEQTSPQETDEKGQIDETEKEDDKFKYPLLALLLMFLGGLGTSVLPCTYPIIPLTVSYLGSKENKTILESFFNSLIYVLGMAVIYGLLGVIAALVGEAFGSFAFNPYVLTPIVIVLMFLMFSMLGYYEIQFPASLQKLKSDTAQKSKSKGGIFLFGMVAGLVATPCALPVVTAALIYVASSVQDASNTFQYMMNVGYGFLLMFVFSLGLGVLFILLGTFSGLRSKLPKSGNWMVVILRLLGIVLGGVVVYYLHELFTLVQIGFGEFSSWLLSIGIVGLIFGILLLQEKYPKGRNIKNDLLVGLSVILIASGIIFQTVSILVFGSGILTLTAKIIILIISVVLGVLFSLKKDFSRFMFPKVKDLFSGLAIFFIIVAVIFGTSLTFDLMGRDVSVSGVEEKETLGGEKLYPYEEALKMAKEEDKLIFIDFWATWCTNCAEFEEFAEYNNEMQEFLSNFIIVRINYDLNKDFAVDKFNVPSLPNFIFINHKEEVVLRKSGFADPYEFLDELKRDFDWYID
jgi:thiol:disulfide interchange protein